MTEPKDLFIGAINNYGWDQIKVCVNSLEASGFDGHKIMIVFNGAKTVVDKLIERGWLIVGFGETESHLTHQPMGNLTVHVERFFHIWNTLDKIVKEEQPVYVITTDVKDVVFQSNPSDWLRIHMGNYNLVSSSEGLVYENESWGNQNLLDCFGPYFHQRWKHNEIYNVGVLAGRYEYIKQLALNIFQTSLNRPIPIVDQAVFNYLMWQKPWKQHFYPDFPGNVPLAAHLGTLMDPSKIEQFRPNLTTLEPRFEKDKVIVGHDQNTFERSIYPIVHQYDRVPKLKAFFEEKFGGS